MTNCCIDCFQDEKVKLKLTKVNSGIGICNFCRNEDKLITSTELLTELFEGITAILEENVNGTSAASIVQEHLGICSENESSIELLASILTFFDSTKNYSLKFASNSITEEWGKLKQEIKERKRFFPETGIIPNLLNDTPSSSVFSEILEQLTYISEINTTYFRSRISNKLLASSDLGMPPKDLVSNGRANPIGIPYLYVANNVKTAIHEVRPHNGQVVYCSEFKNNRKLNILDLTEPLKKSSALKFEDDKLPEFIQLIKLLTLISEELSKPINPHTANIDYIPTQYFTELLMKAGNIDGIKYVSSFKNGFNYVFFSQDEKEFTITEPLPYKVNQNICDFGQVIDS